MDVSRMIIAICGFALSVCLFLSIGALSGLRHAMAQSNQMQEEAEELIERLDDRLQELDSIPTDLQPAPSEETKEEQEYLISSVNRMIGVYSKNGTLLRILDVSIDSLPKTERERLQTGILAASWQEVETLLADYET